MPAIAWSDVTAIAPELSAVVAATQNAILADVETMLVKDQWESTARWKLGLKYLAAHLGTISLRGGTGASGPITSETLGQMSRAYAAFSPMGSDPLLDSTPYGKQYRALVRQLPRRVGLVL